jgi:hypothetical protein
MSMVKLAAIMALPLLAKVNRGTISQIKPCPGRRRLLVIGVPTIDSIKGGGALCAGSAVALLVFGPVMP